MQRLRVAAIGAIWLALGAAGCEDDTVDPGRQIAEVGVDGDAGGSGGQAGQGGGGAGGTGGAMDLGPDAADAMRDMIPLPDLGDAVVDGGPRPIESCLDLCSVYRDCDRAGLWPDADACVARCTDTRDTPAWTPWRDCLAIAACDALETCEVPPAPPPTCAEVCAAVAVCGPGRWGGVDPADCPSTCADPATAEIIGGCGAAVVAGACDDPDFARCFYAGTDPTCVAACDRDVACGFAEEAACVDACVTAADPAAARRATERAQCVAAADTCDAAQACDAPPAVDPRAEALCAADAACGQFPEGEACLPVVTRLVRRGADDVAQCLAGQLAGCAAGVVDCMVPEWGTAEQCERACGDRFACGFLYDERTAEQCTADCQAAFAPGADFAASGPYQRTLECVGQASCAELETCMQGFEARFECAQHCNRMWDCGARIKPPEECTPNCNADYRFDRWQAQLHCEFDARDCPARARCEVAASPDCEAVCERLGECGDQGDCRRRCDDLHFRDSVGYERLLSCVWASDRCEDREACWVDPSRGDACLAWCVPGFACQGPPDGYLPCVESCAERGVGSYGGLAFRRIEACLAQQGRGAGCDVTQVTCPLPAHDAGFCPLVCDAVAACGGDRAACLGTCEADFDSAALTRRASNALRAQARGEGCPAVLSEWAGE